MRCRVKSWREKVFGCYLCLAENQVVFMAAEDELYSFEGARSTFPAEQDDIGNEDETSNSGSDLETGESEGSQSAKELHHIRRDRGQKRRPAVSESESDDPFSNLLTFSKPRKFSKLPKRYKSTLSASSKSSTVPSTPKTATPKNSMATTPKIVPRSAPPKRSLPSTSATGTHKSATPSRSTSTKDAHSSVSAKETTSTTAEKDKGKEFESLSIAVLQEISSKLNSVAERVVRMETKLEAMEKRSTPSSSSDARTPKQKRVIPHTLRVSMLK